MTRDSIQEAFEAWFTDYYVKQLPRNDADAAWMGYLAGYQAGQRWLPIESAPEGDFIVVAVPYGSRWLFHHVFNEYGEWVDVHSDRIVNPTYWMPSPPEPAAKEENGDG